MKQCQNCGNSMPVTAIGWYCPKCTSIISENNEKQRIKDIKIKKEQDLELIEKGYDPDIVDAFFRIGMWHIFGTPLFVLFTIPVISSIDYWYWIIGIWEVFYWGNLWLANLSVYSKSNTKCASGFSENDVIAYKITNRIFTIYCIIIAIYYVYVWFIKPTQIIN